MTPDNELLCDYARTNSQEAFAELVRRHVNLVYSVALRLLGGDPHLAQDVAQTVFTDLARRAGPLSRRASLSGWLYTGTRFAAAKMARAEHRRRDRENRFMTEPPAESPPEVDWQQIRPVLEEAMHELKEKDREAVLLRYFENRHFAEVGEKLGVNENAARMRVERALDKLRTAFARRGIVTRAALGVLLSANAVQLAPTGLAATLTAASTIAAGTGAASGTLLLSKLMTATQLKLCVSGLILATAALTLVIQHQAAQKLRLENDSLRQEIAQLKIDNENRSSPPPATTDTASRADAQFNELLRLRGDVGVLRRQTNELGTLLANSRTRQAREQSPMPEQTPSPLPEDYPKTADGATKGIFEAWARGDWDTFFKNFGEPGVPREVYDRAFSDPAKSNYLYGMEIVSLGQPTNSFSSNMWFVPYRLRFRDGSEKEFQLHVAHDPRSQRWFFKGGF